MSDRIEKATFGAGCFWGVEEAFQDLEGVTNTAVGYSGGHTESPTYKEVCSGFTGHAEVVEVEFDSNIISYSDILKVFWKIHNPTLLNRQGPDIGSQYRSVIFFHTPEQQKIAEKSKLEEQKNYTEEIVTQIALASPFYRAEEYHQCYLKKNPRMY